MARLLLGVLLHQKNADARFLDPGEGAEQLGAQQRRQTERGLVEQEDRRRRHHRAADRHHLPFAAAHRAHELLGTLAQLGKQGQDARQIVRLALARPVGMGAEREILLHGEIGEDAAILGHQRDAGLHDLMRRAVGDVGPVHEHGRAVHLARLPGYGPQEGALAGAIGAEHHHDLAFRHRRRNVLKRAMAAVEDRNVAALKHRRLRDRPGSRRDRPAPPPASLPRSWHRCS